MASDGVPPGKIDLTAESTGHREITLTWIAPSENGSEEPEGRATKYIIKYSQTRITPENWEEIPDSISKEPSDPGTTETLVIKDLIPQKTYYFAIITEDEVPNRSELSNVAEVGVLDKMPPAKIKLTAKTGERASTVTLSWIAPGDDGMEGKASYYIVKYRQDGPVTEANWADSIEFTPARIEWEPKEAEQEEKYDVTGLWSGEKYYFAIKAVDDVGNESEISNSPWAVAGEDKTKPSRIYPLKAKQGKDPFTIVLWWLAPYDDYDDEKSGPVEEYILKYTEQDMSEEEWEANWDKLKTIEEKDIIEGNLTPKEPKTLQEITVSGFSLDKHHYFAIKSKDEAGNLSAVSNPAWVDLKDLVPPGKVDDLFAKLIKDEYGASTIVELKWTPPYDDAYQKGSGPASHYIIRYSTTDSTGKDWEDEKIWIDLKDLPIPLDPDKLLPGQKQTHLVKGLPAGKYYFALKSVDNQGNISELSNITGKIEIPEAGGPDISGLRAYEYKDEKKPIRKEQWQKDNDPYFVWDQPPIDPSKFEGYSYSLDTLPPDTPNILSFNENYYQYSDDSIPDGKHTFYVKAKFAGVWGKPASFEIWVDAKRPRVIKVSPAEGGATNDSTPLIEAWLSDEGSGIKSSTIELDVSQHSPVSFHWDGPPENRVYYKVLSPLEDGDIKVSLFFEDRVGNKDTTPFVWSFMIDTKPPTGSIKINGDASQTDSSRVLLHLKAEDDEGSGVKEMIISNEDPKFGGSLWQDYQEEIFWDLPPQLGERTVYVKYKDRAGNVSEVKNDSIKLISVAPDTYIIEAPPFRTREKTAKFKYTASQQPGCEFSYSLDSLDNGAWSKWSEETSVEFKDLSLGTYTFKVKARKDTKEDLTPAIWSWEITEKGSLGIPSKRPIKYYTYELEE
ncbi:TPA: hypothetical protein DCX15_00005 [bacterium]|nr:hypothetical protein [bacterium]